MIIKPTPIAVCVNKRYKVIFVHIPKNAGTSLREVIFQRYQCRLDMRRSPEKRDIEILKYREQGYKLFTIWRPDVVDRFMTAYLEDSQRTFIKPTHWMRKLKWFQKKSLRDQFMTYLSEAEQYGGMGHCIKQTEAVKDRSGIMRHFDYNFTMETVRYISKELFNGVTIPKKKSNQIRKHTIAPFLSRDVKERIKTLYESDTAYISKLERDGQIWKKD